MKKGFTLIELLAVILILGIIALIAIPTVNNILKESRRGAFQSTITNIEKAVQEKCTTEQIKNQEITTMYTITSGVISPNLDIKGELPDGEIYINNECIVSYTLSNNNFIASKEFDGELVINEKGSGPVKYTEAILNGTDPVVTSNLIPVTIDNDGTVRRADLYSKWYSYAEKKWANAVILTEGGKVEDDGTILEDSIESYFVWIPRYKYKLFDMGLYEDAINEDSNASTTHPVEIIFENKNTPLSVGTEVGQYYSHPAFQDFDTNGLWIGKFMVSHDGENLMIKPNKVRSNGDVKTAFEKSYNYKRENDSHLTKNTEWGAVTYLSLSKYGIQGETNINNNTDFITGYGAVIGSNQSSLPNDYGTDPSVTLPYNTESGYLASTTGNITGIYDMNGPAEELVAAFMDGHLGNSGFTVDPTTIYGEKYFNKYPNSSNRSSFNNRILGDATGELGPFYKTPKEVYGLEFYHNIWYNDFSTFVNETSPWFMRGGNYTMGFISGQLAFECASGSSGSLVSYRLVLAK